MGEVQALHGAEGAMKFLALYMAAPDSSDVEIRLGWNGDNERVVAVSISGVFLCLSAKQARALANAAEKAMNRSGDSEFYGFPNLIMGLRFGADKLDQN